MRLLSAAILGSSLLAADGMAQEPKRPELSGQVQTQAKRTYADLVRLLSAESFRDREAAEKELLRCGSLDAWLGFPAGRSLLDPSDAHDLEQKKRLARIVPKIRLEEGRKALHTPSIFKAPPEWNQPGYTVSMREAFETLSSATGQGIAYQYASSFYLDDQVPTQGLDGKVFWSAFHALRTLQGAGPKITTNAAGSIYTLLGSDAPESHTVAHAGAVAGFLEEAAFFSHQRKLSVQVEPRFQVVEWRMITGEVIHTNGLAKQLNISGEAKETDSRAYVPLPSTLQGGEKVLVRVTLEVTVVSGRRERIQNLLAPKHFVGDGYEVNYLGMVQGNDGSFVLSADLQGGQFGLPAGMRKRFYCSVLDHAHVIRREPEGNDAGRHEWILPKEPSEIWFYLPGFQQFTSRFTLDFPNVELQKE